MEKKESYIVLYTDEFDTDVWEAYCVATGSPLSSVEIKIRFDYKDVEYIDEEENENKIDLEEELPTEEEIGRPSSIDSIKRLEKYAKDYLEEEFGASIQSLQIEFDSRRIYITNIIWKKEK